MRSSRTEEPAKVWISDNGTIHIRAPFNASFVEYLKQYPKSKRRWDPAKKIWEIEYELLDSVLDLVGRFYADAINVNTGKDRVATEVRGSDAWSKLRSVLTASDLSYLHKILAKKYHPDIGGDAKKMSTINRCFEDLRNGK